jgi:amidohydrolase
MDAKQTAQAAVRTQSDALIDLSHRVHSHPELGFEEERASTWLAEMLTDGGYAVEAGIAGLPTAFVATVGTGPLTVAICAEYDALPGIGHACGHNVIAAAATGAGLALAGLADDLGLTVKVFGTPAEEGGGGKIVMLEQGAFAGVHAAMMVHPGPTEQPTMACLAVSHLDVHYTGKSAHASAAPEQGINAADAITVAQVGIGLLRQHIGPNDRIHGIVTHGGDAPNIVPESTEAKFYVRAKTMAELEVLEPRVHRCFEAGALATGCTLRIEQGSPVYSEMIYDVELAAIYQGHAESLGRTFPGGSPEELQRFAGSTDMANVSLVLPTIHPMLGLNCLPVVNHQPEFTALCATPIADQAALDGALSMAWSCVDLSAPGSLRDRLLGAGIAD